MLGSRAELAGFAGLAASSSRKKHWNCHLDKANHVPKGFETCQGRNKFSLGIWELGKGCSTGWKNAGVTTRIAPMDLASHLEKFSPYSKAQSEKQNLKMESCTKTGAGIFPEIKGLREWISEGKPI